MVQIWRFSKWLQVHIVCAYVYQNPDVTLPLFEKRSSIAMGGFYTEQPLTTISGRIQEQHGSTSGTTKYHQIKELNTDLRYVCNQQRWKQP